MDSKRPAECIARQPKVSPLVTRLQPTVGCVFKDTHALSRTASPTLIAEYQTQLPERALLLRKLHEFYELAQTSAETDSPKRKPRKSLK